MVQPTSMTITEKYIQQIVPLLAVAEGSKVSTKQMNGAIAYLFPCPFCSHLNTQSGKQKPRKQTAILMPRRESKWVYTFKCHRGGSSQCSGAAVSFNNFLHEYNKPIFKRYQLEMNNR